MVVLAQGTLALIRVQRPGAAVHETSQSHTAVPGDLSLRRSPIRIFVGRWQDCVVDHDIDRSRNGDKSGLARSKGMGWTPACSRLRLARGRINARLRNLVGLSQLDRDRVGHDAAGAGDDYPLSRESCHVNLFQSSAGPVSSRWMCGGPASPRLPEASSRRPGERGADVLGVG